MQRIPLFRTSRFHDGFGIAMSMVDLLCDRLTGTDAVQVIGVANAALAGIAAAGCAAQSPAAGPAKGPIPTVVVGGGIAAAIVFELMAIKGHKQILPILVIIEASP